jgi:hypothetical protein
MRHPQGSQIKIVHKQKVYLDPTPMPVFALHRACPAAALFAILPAQKKNYKPGQPMYLGGAVPLRSLAGPLLYIYYLPAIGRTFSLSDVLIFYYLCMGQASYDQLLLNPPDRKRSKGERL